MFTLQEIMQFADSGDVNAMVAAVQQFVWEMDIDLSADPELKDKLIDYTMKAIDAGNAEAMNQLGSMYAEGKLVKKDPAESFRWYKEASEHGDALGTSNLGFCYLYGKGTEVDYEKAFKTFSKAAVLGIGDAIVRLGDMYLNGYYIGQDKATAWSLYNQAAAMASGHLDDLGMQQVYSDALLRLGNCYFKGDAVEVDLVHAISNYSEALRYYVIRDAQGVPYCVSGLKKTKEMLKAAVAQLQ